MARDELVQKVVEAVLAQLAESQQPSAPAASAPAGAGCVPAAR